MRVRHITQDDAHIFCTEDQIQDEVIGCLDFGFYLYDLFGFEPRLELSTRPDNRIGTDEMWDHAEAALAGALDAKGLAYDINPGDGAFYGPKIDLHLKDSIGRSWQLGTVQLDYSMPERFGLVYTGADDAEHRPVMIHRALFGSFERFIGILTEHYAGEFPFWLAPLQAVVLPIADRHADGGRRPRPPSCATAGVRVEVDERPGVGRAQDPRRRAAQGPVHARGRRPRGARAARSPCGATARATRAASRWPSWPPGSAPGRRRGLDPPGYTSPR